MVVVATEPASAKRFSCHKPGFAGEKAAGSCRMLPWLGFPTPPAANTAADLRGLSPYMMILQENNNVKEFT